MGSRVRWINLLFGLFFVAVALLTLPTAFDVIPYPGLIGYDVSIRLGWLMLVAGAAAMWASRNGD